MHTSKHIRNGDVLQNGTTQAVGMALKAAFDSAKVELSTVQDKIANMRNLQNEEIRLIHLIGSLENALGEYEEKGGRDELPRL